MNMKASLLSFKLNTSFAFSILLSLVSNVQFTSVSSIGNRLVIVKKNILCKLLLYKIVRLDAYISGISIAIVSESWYGSDDAEAITL